MKHSKKISVVAVGTTNPVKINAVRLAFGSVWPNKTWQVRGLPVPSGVSSQPMSAGEGITGARNRSVKALQAVVDADFGVGLEGSLEEIEGQWFDCGWCVISDREQHQSVSSSARIPTPEVMMAHIRKGMELGDVLDLLNHRTNIKQQEGHVGILTNTHVTRTDIYTDAVMIALGRFLHPELF